jgi:XTP/dITP diphosphohydrolase
MLAAHGVQAIGLDEAGVPADPAEDLIEVFDSFEENALAKARYYFERTGMPCLADDSGLCIDALDGRPGVRSRRFAADVGVADVPAGDEDAANNDAMLVACWNSGWAPPWTAHYACAAALVGAGHSVVAHGRTDGVITPERAGLAGFGYDPYFLSTDLRVTFAVASREEKARVSHRGRAVRALLERLAQDTAGGSGR